MKKLYFLLLSCAFLIGCDKEDASPDITYPATYKGLKYYNTTPVFMYTSIGEVKDRARINAFARRHSTWYYLENKEEPLSSEQSLILYSATEAEISNNGVTTSLEVHTEGDMYVLTNKEEGTVTVTDRQVFFTELQAAVSKYKPVMTDRQEMAPVTGYAYSYKTRSRFYGQLNNQEFLMSRMIITLKRKTGEIVTSASSNVFNPEGLNLLQSGDTLIVQSFINASVKQ